MVTPRKARQAWGRAGLLVPDSHGILTCGPWTWLLTLALLAGCSASGSYSSGSDSSPDDLAASDHKGPTPDAGKPKDAPASWDSGKLQDGAAVQDIAPAKDQKAWPDSKPKKDMVPWPDSKPKKDMVPWPDSKPKKDMVPWPDVKPWPDTTSGPDKWPTPTDCLSVMGKACTQTGGQCGSNATCLLTTAAKGVCACNCTPDNPQTPYNEDTCPNNTANVCGKVSLTSGATQYLCFQKCSPKLGASDCDGNIACDPRSTTLVQGKVNQAVCIFYGCQSDSDCPVQTDTGCSQSTPCPLGQLCIPYNSKTTLGFCAKPGKCDLKSHLCGPHSLGSASAQVGDPCKDDTQCGNNMRCQMQLDLATFQKKQYQTCTDGAECCSGVCQSGSCTAGLCTVDYRNGYCTIPQCLFSATMPHRQCPPGSTCNALYTGGLCQKTCSMTNSASCRDHPADRFGDYECRSWDNLAISGFPVANSPVCDFGTQMPCDLLSGSSLDCTSVGLAPNTTNMTCRSLSNVVLGNPYDPTGYCLDNTAASSTLRSPMPAP